jgi:hypothetical protein
LDLIEELYYPFVQKFLREKMGCFDTFQKAGPKVVGYADVIGIRDIGGRHCGEVEIISVEVKRSRRNLVKCLGQALGYSLFANKCYLAAFMKYNDQYSQEEKDMATRLGVGLLDIRSGECSQVTNSAYHQPINNLSLRTLEYVGYNRCSICSTFFKTDAGWTKDIKKTSQGMDFYYAKKMNDRKILFTEQKRVSRWVTICNDCIQRLKLHQK